MLCGPGQASTCRGGKRKHFKPDRLLGLCQSADARGNLVPDAYHAALAIEYGLEWITFDRGFARYPRLRWSCPLP